MISAKFKGFALSTTLFLFGYSGLFDIQVYKKSDVDVVVEFDRKHIPTLFQLVDIGEELSEIFGRKVDMAVKNAKKAKENPWPFDLNDHQLSY